MIKRLLFFALVCLLMSGFVIAHGDSKEENEENNSAVVDFLDPLLYIYISGFWLLILTIYTLTIGKRFLIKEGNKKLLFWLMVIPIVLSSLFLAGNTIYDNVISDTGGPVHWHADYQVQVCGEKLELIDPKGIKNKVGGADFHEHNDDRIHIEGTVKELSEITLKKYFEIIGGELEDKHGHLIYEDEHKGLVDIENGDSCPYENGKEGILKVYVNGKKMKDFSDYVIYPDPNVPPGDCIIIVFDGNNPGDETTDILCDTWEINGWSYDNYFRETIIIGDKTWQ